MSFIPSSILVVAAWMSLRCMTPKASTAFSARRSADEAPAWAASPAHLVMASSRSCGKLCSRASMPAAARPKAFSVACCVLAAKPSRAFFNTASTPCTLCLVISAVASALRWMMASTASKRVTRSSEVCLSCAAPSSSRRRDPDSISASCRVIVPCAASVFVDKFFPTALSSEVTVVLIVSMACSVRSPILASSVAISSTLRTGDMRTKSSWRRLSVDSNSSSRQIKFVSSSFKRVRQPSSAAANDFA
mmetsp:Transcript_125999/g.364547  ORF Transcript_125999/g.364547 Transcript_125999/m.364547 type:complete len:248 (+) Transcript_125999:167-910(+)